MKTAFAPAQLFDGAQIHEESAVLVEHGKVIGVTGVGDIPSDYQLEKLDGTLAPGFIDWQVNGGGDTLFNNEPTVEGLKKIVSGHLRGGTTSMMATLVSDTPEIRSKAVKAVYDLIQSGTTGVLGLHLEGPFFALERRGTHDENHISSISDADIEWLCSIQGFPLIVTLAPELTQSGQIHSLSEQGIIVCAGHTDASSSEIQSALTEGLRGFTHLYNAMRPASAREPGVVGSALLDEHSWCGVIVDGHHVHMDMVRLAQMVKPLGKLCLVSDAMATVGGEKSSFELYGNTITEKNGCLINHEGRLAGSAISMIDAVRNCHLEAGISLTESLRMASVYPAEFLGVDDTLGFFKKGYQADMVHFDRNFCVTQTWVAGEAML